MKRQEGEERRKKFEALVATGVSIAKQRLQALLRKGTAEGTAFHAVSSASSGGKADTAHPDGQ